IPVLPTPFGPIIRMFFGRISRDISGSSCCRRHRFRSAIATARLAGAWPMAYLPSSPPISRGVRAPGWVAERRGAAAASPGAVSPGIRKTTSELLQRDVVVRVDVDLARDRQRLARDFRGRESRAMRAERPRGGERVRTARAHRENSLLRRDQVSRAGEEQRGAAVRDDQERFELAQHLVGPPVLCEHDRGQLQVPALLVWLRLARTKQAERVAAWVHVN